MSARSHPPIVDLDDADLTVANPEDDVRGKSVIDRDGEEVGDVDGLLVDEDEHRVRFLKVGSGGFLGIGEEERLIPVEAVTEVEDQVHVDTTREDIAGSPTYDPEIVSDFTAYYDHYGARPFWMAPGYVYPGEPHGMPFP